MKKSFKQLRKILRDKGVDITESKYNVVKHTKGKEDKLQFVLDPECGRAIYKSMKRKVANA